MAVATIRQELRASHQERCLMQQIGSEFAEAGLWRIAEWYKAQAIKLAVREFELNGLLDQLDEARKAGASALENEVPN